MKHVPQDKYNVAWFTLAECVARGERIRALGVYRLLAHSIDDTAFARQLEGDILLAFQDKHDAVTKYKEAARLYQSNNKLLEAAAIYEHLVDLEPETLGHLMHLANLYEKIGFDKKATYNLKLLFDGTLRTNDLTCCQQTLEKLDRLLGTEQTMHEHAQMTFAVMRNQLHQPEHVSDHIKNAVEGFISSNDSRSLNKFLATLEALNPAYASQAREIINKDDPE